MLRAARGRGVRGPLARQGLVAAMLHAARGDSVLGRLALRALVVAVPHVAACVLLACDADTRSVVRDEDASFAHTVIAERAAFCARPDVRQRNTPIDRLFCTSDDPPAISSLRDLQEQLELVPFAIEQDGIARRRNEAVLLAHSTSLPGRLVSPINPRAFIVGKDSILAYVRGAQEVELVSRASDGSEALTFYLLRYQQACNHSDAGCSPSELYSPATEQGWTSLQLRDDHELENTPSDCRACHARGGEQPRLLMREVDGPWTHFFDTLNPAEIGSASPEVKGYDLLQDYLAAKGGEPYAGIDLTQLAPSTAQALELVVGLAQPVYFDSLAIERERWPRGPNGYEAEPRRSPTWQAAYDAWKRGEQLALPHYAPRPTSPEKQARISEAYVRFREQGDALPELSDIFPDDPVLRAEIGLEVEPDASPVELLIQACAPCHNDVLNQELSRARFNVDLARMDDDELDLAIERLVLPRTAAGAMPPLHARAVPEPARARLIEYLRSQGRGGDPRLAHAAEMGMRGGSRPARR